ncbi:MAG: DNA polymerase I [Dermatophilus congolensis]|nr:DNA polymerase I [Dermatophilus congolensis]
MGRLLLLDGHSLAYRAFFALPAQNFATKTGQTTNAVFGFTSMLINLLRDEEPTHLAVAFDLSKPTQRLAEYPEYKAGRAATPDEFRSQIPLIIEVLDALAIPHLSVEGYEADDVIATLATRGAAAGHEILICSGDRDTMQLVTDEVTVLYPLKGVSELARLHPEGVADRYLVAPELYSDLAALVGESADNLPGVPGVGPKTAAKWLGQYADLHGIVAHADEIKGKAGESLRANLDQVLRNRRLNTLERDLDLPLSVEDTERTGFDREAVHTLFDSLEFRVLRERLFEVVGGDDDASADASQSVEVDESVLESVEVEAWLAAHAPAGGRVGVLIEGSWGRGAGDAWGIAIGAADDHSAFIDLESLDPAGEAALARWLADPNCGKVLHDAKGPLHALHSRGLDVAGLVCDTALAAYLVHPDQRTYDLGDLAMRYLRRELTAGDATGQGMLDLGGADSAQHSEAMGKARAVLDLADALEEQLTEQHTLGLLTDVELPLVDCLARMERIGIAVDAEALQERERYFADGVASAAADAYEAIGHEVNLASPKQLQVVLFEELDLPKTKRTKTGYTTDADALTMLFEKTEHPFLAALLRHRDASKLRSTVEGLIKSIGDDGRIHTTYQQTIAATGRLSSTDPNLQNIPIRTDEGRRIRSVFVAGHSGDSGLGGAGESVEFESLMSADYSQIEMRIMAHLSGDEGLIEAFRTGEDLHRFVGSRVFSVEPAEVTPAMRAKVKAMSYGLAYGLSAFGLSKQLSIPTSEASALMEEYFLRFGGVRDYLAEVVVAARAQGYTETMMGRRRYLPDLNSSNRQRREMAERMALNAPIQGSAADIIKVAMLGVEKALAEQGLASRMLLQVHDELVFEVAPGEQEALAQLVTEQMGAAIELDVPLEVSIGVGPNWEQAAH